MQETHEDEIPVGGGGAPGLRFAILIVAYNAVHTLAKVLDRIPREAWDQVEEVFVFDDASKNDTFLVGLGYKSMHGAEKLKIYRNSCNLGYGGNQKLGYAYALERGFDYVILLHGDGQYAPEMLPEFMRMARERRPAAVFGSRMMKRGDARKGGMPFYKYAGNIILTGAENVLLGANLSEFHSGYRMYSVDTLRKLHFHAFTDDFHFDTQIIVALLHHGFEIVEIPIPTYYGTEICYVNGIRYAKEVMLSVLRYKLHRLGVLNCSWIGDASTPPQRYVPKLSPLSSHGRIGQIVPDRSRVLDVGAEGSYVDALRRKGCTIVGIGDRPPGPGNGGYDDYHVRDVEQGGLPTFQEAGRFDCVILADVLEHVRPARAVLSDARNLLADRGVIIVSTGNAANWTVRLGLLFGWFTYRRRGILDEGHVHLYTRRSFRELVLGQGFRILRSEVTPIPFELLATSGRISRSAWKVVEYGYYVLTRLWPTLFGFQFIFVAAPARREEEMHPMQVVEPAASGRGAEWGAARP